MAQPSRTTRSIKAVAALVVGLAFLGGATGTAAPDRTAQALGEPANLGLAKRDVVQYYRGWRDAQGHNHHSADSPWGHDTESEIDRAQSYLAARLGAGVDRPAIVLDIDDTSEITYGWQADNDFGFDRARQQAAIEQGVFEVIEPTLDLARWADERGVRVYFITGRRDTLAGPSVRNLEHHGYPVAADRVYFKPTSNPAPYLTCGLSCRVGEFKDLTRAHIQDDLGDTIVLNVGDQHSDFDGGHAEREVKLPNPMYHVA
ncbi:HAD family acid phosphatase [Actinosynnema sp. NPDC059335]|uniref:HAD family acid phosphatase n=1 Tax=Actinosynnema sp. NPDC059335 TaxID=3346804 RepID=UPI0036734EAC